MSSKLTLPPHQQLPLARPGLTGAFLEAAAHGPRGASTPCFKGRGHGDEREHPEARLPAALGIASPSPGGAPHPLKAVLARPDPVEDLAVDELRTDGILAGVVPGAEELLPEVEAPGRLALALAPLPCQLLTLANGIHHVVAPTAQRPELRQGGLQSGCCARHWGYLRSATLVGSSTQGSGLSVAPSLLPLAPREGRAGALLP